MCAAGHATPERLWILADSDKGAPTRANPAPVHLHRTAVIFCFVCPAAGAGGVGGGRPPAAGAHGAAGPAARRLHVDSAEVLCCSTEQELLLAWRAWLLQADPDLIVTFQV